MDENKIIMTHDFSINNKELLLNDNKCGCFFCLKIFNPSEIKSWIFDGGQTAICPYCGVDSVIGEGSNYSITLEFLEKMKKYWF